MTILTKSLLVVSVAGIVVGSFLDFGGFTVNPSWTVVLPFGVIGYGFFLISLALGKESAKFDLDKAGGSGLFQVTPAAPALTSFPLILPLPAGQFGH
jgi:hypothetical protein